MIGGLFKRRLTEAPPPPDLEIAAILAKRLTEAGFTRLGRALTLFHIDAGGGCGGCGLEIEALRSPLTALAESGLSFARTPADAHILLISAAPTCALRAPLLAAAASMPRPRWIVAIGDCAAGHNPFRGTYPMDVDLGALLPIDLIIPGAPPSPTEILAALLSLIAANDEDQRMGQARRLAPISDPGESG